MNLIGTGSARQERNQRLPERNRTPLSNPRVIAETLTLCTHCLIPGHTANKCFQKAQGKPATTLADALSRQAMYCTLCKKKGSHEAADCFKRPGHTVLAAWAQSSLRTPTTPPETHEWAGMDTASVNDSPDTTSSESNLPLHMDTTTSIPTSTNRLLVLEEIHAIQCAISTANIAIELRQAQIAPLKHDSLHV